MTGYVRQLKNNFFQVLVNLKACTQLCITGLVLEKSITSIIVRVVTVYKILL